VWQIECTLRLGAISESDEEGVGFGWVELNVRDVSGELHGRRSWGQFAFMLAG